MLDERCPRTGGVVGDVPACLHLCFGRFNTTNISVHLSGLGNWARQLRTIEACLLERNAVRRMVEPGKCASQGLGEQSHCPSQHPQSVPSFHTYNAAVGLLPMRGLIRDT